MTRIVENMNIKKGQPLSGCHFLCDFCGLVFSKNIFSMQKDILIAVVFSTLAIFGCKGEDDAVKETEDSAFTDRKMLSKIKNDEINEASGLEVSAVNNNMFWVHNDSGGQPRLFLLDGNGNDVFTCYLHGIENRDWEDIAVGSGPIEGESYLYIAEMGDNNAVHDWKYIYRLKEPLWNDKEESAVVEDFDKLTFQFPDGNRDAETLMLDPKTRDIYIISKREEKVNVYIAPYPQPFGDTTTLKKVGVLPFDLAVAGDISDDGRQVLIKTYDWIFYWEKKGQESIDSLLKNTPIKLPYTREPQGEAIAWAKDGSGYYTVSEEADGIEPVLYYYQRK